MRRFAILCLLAAGVLVATACSKAASTTVAPSATSAPTVPLTSPSTTAAAGLSITLAHMPTGTAQLSWDATTKVITATLNMYGFTPGSSHAMHIHTGSCLNQQNPPVIPFPDAVADGTGVVKASVKSNPVSGGIPTGAYLNIHLAPGDQLGAPGTVGFTPIACADIPAGTPAAGPVSLTMQALPQTGQHPTATAALHYDSSAQTLTVEVKATGLPPGSAHAEHIHVGSCLDQSRVLYPLTDLTADGSGAADQTTIVHNVANPPPPAGWYVNIHMGPSSVILSGGQPTMLFAPILCADVTG